MMRGGDILGAEQRLLGRSLKASIETFSLMR